MKAIAYVNGGKMGAAKESKSYAAKYVLPGADNHTVGFYAKAEKTSIRGIIGNLQMPKPPGGLTCNLCRCKASLLPHEVGKWIQPFFDDSDWPQAEEIAVQGEEPFEQIIDVSPFARWIWVATEEFRLEDTPQEAYCRCAIMASNPTSKTCSTVLERATLP